MGTEAKHTVSKYTLSDYRFVKCLNHVIAVISYCYKETTTPFNHRGESCTTFSSHNKSVN